jgi:hypothetical protein
MYFKLLDIKSLLPVGGHDHGKPSISIPIFVQSPLQSVDMTIKFSEQKQASQRIKNLLKNTYSASGTSPVGGHDH